LKEGPLNKGISETTKRGKLAMLAGFDLEMKKDSLVPKDTNFSLWLNVARFKT
jgi:hypothetical protein